MGVAARRIAHHLDRELGIDRRAVGRLRRPRQRRCGTGRARATASATRGSPGGRCGQFMPSIAAKIGSLPPVSRQRSRTLRTDSAMPSAGWWQRDAGAAVLADRLEERMALRLDGPGGVQQADLTAIIGISSIGGSGVPCPGAHQPSAVPDCAATTSHRADGATTARPITRRSEVCPPTGGPGGRRHGEPFAQCPRQRGCRTIRDAWRR